MVGFEWWSNEVGIVVVGMIGKKELAVYTIALNIAAFLFMVWLRVLHNDTSNVCFTLSQYP